MIKNPLRIIWKNFRSDYWLWIPSFCAVGVQWGYIFTFNYPVLLPTTWGIMFGCTTLFILLNIIIIFYIIRSQKIVTKLDPPYLDEQWDWIERHCLFFYKRNRYEVWIPKKTTRLAFKLRWA